MIIIIIIIIVIIISIIIIIIIIICIKLLSLSLYTATVADTASDSTVAVLPICHIICWRAETCYCSRGYIISYVGERRHVTAHVDMLYHMLESGDMLLLTWICYIICWRAETCYCSRGHVILYVGERTCYCSHGYVILGRDILYTTTSWMRFLRLQMC